MTQFTLFDKPMFCLRMSSWIQSITKQPAILTKMWRFPCRLYNECFPKDFNRQFFLEKNQELVCIFENIFCFVRSLTDTIVSLNWIANRFQLFRFLHLPTISLIDYSCFISIRTIFRLTKKTITLLSVWWFFTSILYSMILTESRV